MLRIVPEPSPEERAAILLALGSLDGSGDRPSEWWRLGIREAVEDDEWTTLG